MTALMERFYAIFFTLIFSLNFSALASDIDDAEKYIKEQKYETAFQHLHAKDPKYNNPALVSKMAQIAIQYSAVCISGRIFSFEDLKDNETLEQIRSRQSNHKAYPFEIEKQLTKLTRKYPKDADLKLALADFYFSGICGISESKVKRAESFYDLVYGKTPFSAQSLQNYGVLKMQAKNDELAIKLFNEALALDDTLAASHYNVALAHHDAQKPDQALLHALKAVEHYSDKKLKSESAMLTSFIYMDLNDKELSLKFAQQADDQKHMNYYMIYKSLLEVYLKQNEVKLADNVADRLLAMQPENVAMAETVLTQYINNGKDAEFFKFLKRNKSKYRKNNGALGNLWFQEGRYFLEVKKDLNQAEKAYLIAKKEFSKGHIPDHPAFKPLEQILEYIKENKNKI